MYTYFDIQIDVYKQISMYTNVYMYMSANPYLCVYIFNVFKYI